MEIGNEKGERGRGFWMEESGKGFRKRKTGKGNLLEGVLTMNGGNGDVDVMGHIGGSSGVTIAKFGDWRSSDLAIWRSAGQKMRE